MDKSAFRKILEKRMEEFYQKELEQAPSSELSDLISRMQSLTLAGGKRFRSWLSFLTYSAYGGKDIDKLISVALSSEVLHNSILIHDDIIDNDLQRYGVFNITGQYLQTFATISKEKDRLRLAEGMALLAGDLGFSFAYKNILSLGYLNEIVKLQLLKLLTDYNIELLAGQQMDTLNIGPLVTSFSLDKLITTHLLKSSSYSTLLPMMMAATLLDVEDEEQDKIKEFARALGIVYQLVDDYSDYFTNKTEFNIKPKYRDYRQGKITYTYFVAQGLAKDSDLESLKANLGNKELSEDILEMITRILENCGAKQKTIDFIHLYAAKAEEALDRLSISEISKKSIRDLVHQYENVI